MKKSMLAIVFAVAFIFSATAAWAGRGHENDDKPRVNAETMSLIGLAAASAIGTGAYLVRRYKYHR